MPTPHNCLHDRRSGRLPDVQPAGGRQRDDVGDVRRARRRLRAGRRRPEHPRVRHARGRRRRSSPAPTSASSRRSRRATTACEYERRLEHVIDRLERVARADHRPGGGRRGRRRLRDRAGLRSARLHAGGPVRRADRAHAGQLPVGRRTARVSSSTSGRRGRRTCSSPGGCIDAAEAAALGLVTRHGGTGGHRAAVVDELAGDDRTPTRR